MHPVFYVVVSNVVFFVDFDVAVGMDVAARTRVVVEGGVKADVRDSRSKSYLRTVFVCRRDCEWLTRWW